MLIKKVIVIIIVFELFSAFIFAEDYGSIADNIKEQVKGERAPSTAAIYSYLLPGLGDVYLDNWGSGALKLGVSLSLLYWSVIYKQSSNPYTEANVPSVLYSKWNEICTYDIYQYAKKKYNNSGYSIPLEKKSFIELITAPFNPKYIFRPGVLFSMALAAGVSVLQVNSYEDRGQSYSEVKTIEIAGSIYNRGDGTILYETLWGGVSFGAGVGEEFLYRGVLQSEITNNTDPLTGLLCASGIFGMLHLSNPGRSNDYLYPVFATLAGSYFGYLYMKNDYQLSESIAAHFWWDFVVGTVWFIMDPKDNPIGAKITFAF